MKQACVASIGDDTDTLDVKILLCAALVILGTAGSISHAAEPGANCAPILHAMAKTLQADHATVSESGGNTTHGITASGVNYLQVNNVWKVSKLTPKDNQDRSDENLRNAKSFVCQSLPDGITDGVAVANYRTRTETDEGFVESTIAISKATGLAIKVDNEIDSGSDGKSHYTTHYTYTGIRAPSVEK
jgi:hypothetical protein